MSVKESITRYCLYQPRCHKEVRNKLYELGCTTPEVEVQIMDLLQAGHLNEEKYARAIARGKFRMKQWGKRKIVEQLKQQQVSAYCIKQALTEIDEDDYLNTAKSLVEKKLHELRTERDSKKKQQKVFRYLLQKGYDTNTINEAINEILKHP